MSTHACAESLLELAKYSAGYSNTPIFAPVDLSLAAGELILVTGENGVGKSTLLRGIAGLCDFEWGAVSIQGHPLLATQTWRRHRRGLAYVSQTAPLFDSLSVSENIDLATSIRKRSNSDIDMQSRDFLRQVLSSEDYTQPVGRLSGGEKRVVAIARALGTEPSVLLLDEPLAGLSADTRRDTIEVVVRTLTHRHCVSLWTEHDAPELARRCTRVLQLQPNV